MRTTPHSQPRSRIPTLLPPLAGDEEAAHADAAPRAVLKRGHGWPESAHAAEPRARSFVLPSGVAVLSESDSESLVGVDDPHIRSLLMTKIMTNALPALAPRLNAVPLRRCAASTSRPGIQHASPVARRSPRSVTMLPRF